MNIRIHEQLYSAEISDRKLIAFKKKLIKKSVKVDLFLVTLPLGKDGILEVYWYPELLQNFYRNLDVDLFVVGIATSRESAFHLIEQIILDARIDEGNSIKEYFKVS